VLPAGPLRVPLDPQLDRAQAIVIVGEVTGAAPVIIAARARRLPLFLAALEPDRGALTTLAGKKALAFAGIGDPEKFFATIEAAGIEAPVRRGFPDHHRYRATEARALLMEAARNKLVLLTTEKDFARIKGDASLARLADGAIALPVSLAVSESNEFHNFVLGSLRANR
jgi:tetraacyldisaccharide 4'-kinase